MKKILAGLLLSTLCAMPAFAQTYVDEGSNFGNMTEVAPATFSYIDAFWIVDGMPYGEVLGTTTIWVHGQDGSAFNALYDTTITQPVLMLASPSAYNPNTGTYAQQDIGPALDVNGNQAIFQYAPIKAWVSSLSKYVQYDGWRLVSNLPAGAYNLHFSGTSCSGRGCQIQGGSHVFVQTTIPYTPICTLPQIWQYSTQTCVTPSGDDS